MNTRARPTARDLRSRGFSLVEVLVGLVIGIVALLVIYQVFAVSEGYKRTASSGGDAQTTGLVSTFLIAQDLVSAGSTIASSPALANCPSTGDFATTWRPIPALIRGYLHMGAEVCGEPLALFGEDHRQPRVEIPEHLRTRGVRAFATPSRYGEPPT